MYIHQHQKVRVAEVGLEMLGFRLSHSHNSRGNSFWEVADAEGKPFASTLHDGELIQLFAEVLTFQGSNVTPAHILGNRSL